MNYRHLLEVYLNQTVFQESHFFNQMVYVFIGRKFAT